MRSETWIPLFVWTAWTDCVLVLTQHTRGDVDGERALGQQLELPFLELVGLL